NGTLGALATYPPIDCQTIYRNASAWNSGSITHLYARSASCPGYSWGQNLTNSLVGGTISWHYVHGSTQLYLDSKTMQWMFPGLVLKLPDSVNPTIPYEVINVHPELGYVTVMDVASAAGAALQGTGYPTVNSCNSGSCTIGQAAYSWTQY